jgi:hypothetical protein
LTRATCFSWFYEQFTMADGLGWVSRIGLSDYWIRDVLLNLLVDQIVFENATQDFNGVLECAYICLQTLRGTIVGSVAHRRKDWNLQMTGHKELSFLQESLIWVLQKVTKTRNGTSLPALENTYEPPSFAKIAVRKFRDYGVASPGQIRSFEFTTEMSNEQWEEWSLRVKVMAMGAKLGGLGCEPMYAQYRFVRDPDGMCVNGFPPVILH